MEVASSQEDFVPPPGSSPGHFRPQPSTLEDLGLPEVFLAQLALKHAHYMDVFSLKTLAGQMKVNLAIISDLKDYLVKEKCLEARGSDPRQDKINLLGMGILYALTAEGKRRSAQLLEYDSYVGPVPVTLEDYWDQVEVQSIQNAEFGLENLQRAFQDMVIPPGFLEQLGPALMSGKSLFLYGPPGNGKTTIALRVGAVMEDAVLIPYSIYVEGHVIPVFDEITHHPVKPEGRNGPWANDRRWVLCQRPCVVVGGELGMSMLDLSYNPKLKYYGAPLQLKANNGIFVLDDFGRQQIAPQALLNRWIAPLENRLDFLYLCTGQKFGIPFDQLLIFATNLDPASLVDPAYFRRIRAKVKVKNPDQLQFKEIFRLVCENYQMAFNEEAVEYLLSNYYEKPNRNLSACHPRDLVEQILDFCRFNKLTPVLDKAAIDQVCQIYFVE